MADVYRWFDHKGGIIEAPATEGRPTCWRDDGRQAHWMFGKPTEHASFQAMTLCGKRAFEVPGRGAVDCPECIEALG